MNGYICFYKNIRIEVYAKTLYEAQCEAAKRLKVKDKDRYKISVYLAEKNGKTVTHSGAELP